MRKFIFLISFVFVGSLSAHGDGVPGAIDLSAAKNWTIGTLASCTTYFVVDNVVAWRCGGAGFVSSAVAGAASQIVTDTELKPHIFAQAAKIKAGEVLEIALATGVTYYVSKYATNVVTHQMDIEDNFLATLVAGCVVWQVAQKAIQVTISKCTDAICKRFLSSEKAVRR
jgi:hypothetical protein